MNGTGFLRQCAEKEAFNKLRQALLCLPYFLPFQPTETERKAKFRHVRCGKTTRQNGAAKKFFRKALTLSLWQGI